jgi:hypothetical protein
MRSAQDIDFPIVAATESTKLLEGYSYTRLRRIRRLYPADGLKQFRYQNSVARMCGGPGWPLMTSVAMTT